MDSEEFRQVAHDDLDEHIENTDAGIKEVRHFSETDVDELGYINWTALSRVYFNGDTSVDAIHELKDTLTEHDYLAVIDEDNDGTMYLDIQQTYDLSERLGR